MKKSGNIILIKSWTMTVKMKRHHYVTRCEIFDSFNFVNRKKKHERSERNMMYKNVRVDMQKQKRKKREKKNK